MLKGKPVLPEREEEEKNDAERERLKKRKPGGKEEKPTAAEKNALEDVKEKIEFI